MNHPNIQAYEGVEDLNHFNETGFRAYCDEKIAGCSKQTQFIKQLRSSTYEGKVIEIGSGNGKLLFAMERAELLNVGVGYELSRSRAAFADKFQQYLDCTKVSTVCGDYLDAAHPDNSQDVVIAVDAVLQLISPITPEAETALMSRVYQQLKSGGHFIIELFDFSHTLAMAAHVEGELCLWKEFAATDPWQYGLDRMTVKGEDVVWDKRFINRDRGVADSDFTNVLRHYTFDTIKSKLVHHGFSADRIHCHRQWMTAGDIPQDEFIVCAQK